MIDPAAWVLSSSARSSSPAAPGLQAPDRDAPSTNVDPTMTAKPTPVPARPYRPVTSAYASTTRITPPGRPIPPGPARIQATAPKTPAAALVKAIVPLPDNTANRTRFRRMGTESSDEIVSFEDGNAHRPSPAVNLGKRDKMSSPPKQIETPGAARPPKRLRAATRKPEERLGDDLSSATHLSKPVERPSMKTRSRKRR